MSSNLQFAHRQAVLHQPGEVAFRGRDRQAVFPGALEIVAADAPAPVSLLSRLARASEQLRAVLGPYMRDGSMPELR